MPRVVLDDVERQTAPALETWGDLLDWIDGELADEGQIVTAARFDSVDEPAFRDPTVLARGLAAIGTVEVESGTPRTLVLRAMADALDGVDELRTLARGLAEAYRRDGQILPGRGLADIADGVRVLATIVGAVSLATRVDLDHMVSNGRSASNVLGEVTGHVDALVTARQAGDWALVADILEFDLDTSLEDWRAILDAFQHQPSL